MPSGTPSSARHRHQQIRLQATADSLDYLAGGMAPITVEIHPQESSLASQSRPALIKFSTHDCSACLFMAGFEKTVAQALDIDFIDVDMKDLESYLPYRDLLLQQHPKKREISLPTYFLVSKPQGDTCVHGEIVGAMQEHAFRERVSALMNEGFRKKALPDGDQPEGTRQDD